MKVTGEAGWGTREGKAPNIRPEGPQRVAGPPRSRPGTEMQPELDGVAGWGWR